MKKYKALIIIVILIQMSSCNILDRSSVNESKLQQNEFEIVQLKTENESIKLNLHEIEKSISDLQSSQFTTDYTVYRQFKSAILVPGTNTYQVLQTDVGTITVSLQDVQPYANGSQISLLFMNGTGYNYLQPKLKFRWGKFTKTGIIDSDNSKSRTINIDPSIILAGRYNPINVKLDGYPPSELDYVEVSELDWKSLTLKP